MLVYLASRPGEVVSRDDLERIVWHGAIVGYDAVTSTVIKLRKALGDSAREPRYIATIPKRGYQLIASVEHPAAEQVASRTVTGDPATRVISTASGRSVPGPGRYWPLFCSAWPRGCCGSSCLRRCEPTNRQWTADPGRSQALSRRPSSCCHSITSVNRH
ncbi:MAG: winged helix-turn-helix domain-containing protein [Chromatiaceae bacterium]|nr:winged helix-turn-helix domain-containing protein [Chromatiaceae bacterium]